MEARVLFSEEQIRSRVDEIATSLRHRLDEGCPVFVGLLHGGFVFLSDLIRAFDAPHEVDFLKVSRYDPEQKDPATVRIMQDLRGTIRGRNVVVVEGIRARGTKIEYVERFLKLHSPRSIEYCAMVCPVDGNRMVPIHEAGFNIEHEFVVGYGLDFREQHRNLGFISAVDPNLDEIKALQGAK